jgi:predicted O-methyltransferase YrrM
MSNNFVPPAPILRYPEEGNSLFDFGYLWAQRFPRIQSAVKLRLKFYPIQKRMLQFGGAILWEHTKNLARYIDEFFSEHSKFKELEQNFGTLSYYDFVSGSLSFNALFYALTRCLKPEVIVETGVAAGLGSLGWLWALDKNKKGQLISFDLPPSVETDDYSLCRDQSWKYRPKDSSSGWAIPDSLRSRWELTLGDSCEEVGRFVKTCDLFDIFFHDSRHTYQHMKTEFNLVKDKVRQGGLILADDAGPNPAFVELAAELGTKCYFYNNDVGGLRVP